MTPKRYSSVYYSISISNCGNFWDDIGVNNFESIQIRNYGLIIVLCLVNCQTLVSLSLVLRFTWLNYLSLMYVQLNVFSDSFFSITFFETQHFFTFVRLTFFSGSHFFRLTFFQAYIFLDSHFFSLTFVRLTFFSEERLSSREARLDSTQIDSNRLKSTQIDSNRLNRPRSTQFIFM